MLLSHQKLCKTYGHRALFTDLDLHLEAGDRTGIIGANGSGKSTLLKILAGLEDADSGERMAQRNLRIGYVPQEPRFAPGPTVAEALATALAQDAPDPHEGEDGRRVRIEATLGRLGFADPGQDVGLLSGGWQKRLAIAQALIREPDLLLMDEPTNHLDLGSILWLEGVLTATKMTYAIVTHDRTFLERVATTLVELDPRHPGGLLRVDGGYRAFLEKRDAALAARAQNQQALASKVRIELEWLHRGARARRTKAQGHIRQAEALIDDLDRMRSLRVADPAAIEMSSTGRRSQRLIALSGVTKALGGRPLFRDLDLLLMPGLRLGLVGPNGSGKTTLLRLLASELAPDAGKVERAGLLSVVYFEQRREALDPAKSLKRALSPEGDAVVYRGQEVHIAGWARRFGFRTEQLDLPVGRLSGGERAKVAIAQLMLRPADVLLLDEPTNDLDIPTLEVLEESLLDFPGALVLVSHDRFFMARVSSTLLGLDGKGAATPVADIAQWEALVAARDKSAAAPPKPKPVKEPRKKGLSYLEKRELEGMEEAILAAEAHLTATTESLEDPAIASDAAKLQALHAEQLAAQAEVERLYARWAELDAKRQG